MNQKPSASVGAGYRKPFLIALLLHAILLCVLIVNFSSEMFRAPPANAPVQLIHARAIIEGAVKTTPAPSPTKIQPAPKPIQVKPALQKNVVEKKKAKQDNVLMAEKAQKRIEDKAAIAHQKTIDAKKAAAIKQKAMEAKAQALLKTDAQKQLKQAKVAATLKLKQEQNKLQQQLMQQQMLSEEKNISAVVSQAQQGQIDKYKAEILAIIQSNWRIDKVDNKLQCIYSVSIAPDGTVLSEKLMKSSGDDNLDQSAKQAIMASSPLPVPSNPILFNHFRQLILTLSPQGYVQNV